MATQSFTKNFSVSKRNALKVAKVLGSSKKINLERDFNVKQVKKEDIRTFLGMEK